MAKSIKPKRQNGIPKNKDLEKSKPQHEPWQLLTERELSERERKFEHHLQDLKVLQGYIEEAIREYNEFKKNQKETDQWNKYLNCDGLPQPQMPQDMHTFLEKLRYYENIEMENIINWTLSVDERSILSQNIFRKDRTRKTLINEICPNFGKLYEKNVELYLAAIESVDRFLLSDIELASFELRRSKDIVSQRETIENEIQNAFERFTYNIISSQDTYMNSTDGIESNYCYKAKNFSFHIWALRDVPVRFNQMSLPYMTAQLPCVGVQIQIPLSCLFYRLTLRCVYTNFDHYSTNAKSFELIAGKSVDSVIAGVPDIVDCLGREGKMRSLILKEITNKLQDDYNQYEDNLKAFTEKTNQAARESKSLGENIRRKSKTLKPPHEPQQLPDGMYPDIQTLYLKREQQQIDNFLNECFNPDMLNLLPSEINLRKYIILGGIFNIAYVRRPKHVEFETFHVTSHEENKKLHVLGDINTNYRNYETASDEGTKIIDGDEMSVDSKTQIQSEVLNHEWTHSNMNLNNLSSDLSYFTVTFKLPEHICFWSEPIMCQYEESEIEIEHDEEPEQIQNLLYQYTSAAIEYNKLNNQQEVFEETNLSSPRSPILRRSSFNNSASSSNFKNIYRPSLAALLRRKTPEAPLRANKLLPNFYLNKPLNKDEIRALEDFCVPNIISSFKFPMEFGDDGLNSTTKQRKSTKTVFLRKISIESVDEIKPVVNVNVDFNYDVQCQPERVYPIFDGHKPIQFSFTHVHHTVPNSMFKLYNTIDNIEEDYIGNNRKITCQVPTAEGKKDGKYSLSIEPSTTSNFSHLTKRSSLKKYLKKEKSDGNELRLSFLNKAALSESQTPEGLSASSKFSFASEQMKKQKIKIKSKYWTTEHITESILNEDDQTVTVKTDRLGIFGFAYNRYEHFPFRGWNLTPHPKNPQEVVFTLDTRHVRIILNISNKGYTGYITDLQDKYVAKPVRYIDITEPITDIQQLKKCFLEKNFNIFAEHDAKFYITNDYFSEKHLATELHIYNAMSVHCFLLSFQNSIWNRLATRRNMVLCLKNPKETDDSALITVRVTPEDSTFVEVKELCSDIVTVIKLEYTPTWRNIGFYSDLHHLINSLYPQAVDVRNTDSRLIIFLQALLNAIKPLSYS